MEKYLLLLVILPICFFLIYFIVKALINKTSILKQMKSSFNFKSFKFKPTTITLLVMLVTLLTFLIVFIVKKQVLGIVIFIFFVLIVAEFVCYVIFSIKEAKPNDAKIVEFYKKDSVKTVLSSLVAIIVGLLLGCIILLLLAGRKVGGSEISFKAAIDAVQLVFLGAFNVGRDANNSLLYGWNGVNIGDTLFKAMPLIMTGLSVALAFKTGLFNIGAPGQYLMGTFASLVVALTIPTTVVPAFIVWILAFLAAIVAGFIWGLIPGIFKALLNVNEVITCIMTNWISAYLITALFDKTTGPFRFLLDPSQAKNNAYVYKTTHNGVATMKMGLDKIFEGSQVNAGIFVAIIIAVLVFIMLNKTTFGFELKACGSNRHASLYAGIKAKRSIMLSMGIAGGLAASGAALYYLSGNTEFAWETYQKLPATGFNGIPVALLAVNNPIGVCLSATFMAYLDVAGLQIKGMTTYNEHITSIISAIIVYFSAFSLVIKQILTSGFGKKKKQKKEESK